MELHQQYATLLGGLLIGVAAGMVLLANGRVAGVSGIVSSVVRPRSADAGWQALFLVGLVAGGLLLTWLDPLALPTGQIAPLQLTLGAGLLVGFGAAQSARSTSQVEVNAGVWDNQSTAATTTGGGSGRGNSPIEQGLRTSA